MIKIDKLDRKIIAELDMNARIHISKLAKAVRSSREVVQYRINTLIKKGVISGTQTFFNPAKVGYSLYRVLVHLDTLEKETLESFQEYFSDHDYVMWFAKLGGKWDFVIEFFAKNAKQFDIVFEEAINKFKDYIQVFEVSTILEIYCYQRKYIYDNKKETSFLIGGDIQNIKLDKIDLKIINELKSNAQVDNIEIGRKLNLSRNTIKNRIQKLQEKEIISGYKLFYHPGSLGFQSYKLLISMKNLGPQKEKEFFMYAKENPNIIFAHKNLGKWNYEFEIEIENLVKLQEIIVDLRMRFKDLILEYELFPILHDYRIDLFPMTKFL